ncbi:MAG: hypothetical protein GX572_05445, partial [Clostridia bacterium]|nr:hypothetical protein [Clostridia bacterium]
LEQEIAGHIIRLSAMIEELAAVSERPQQIACIALLLCYVKRRCNLFFRERETKAVPAAELTAYIDELAEMAVYADVNILVTSEIKAPLAVRQATLFYDFFYTVIDWAAQQGCPYMLAHLGPEKDLITLRLLPSYDARSFKPAPEPEAAIRAAGGLWAIKDLDGAVGISLAFPKGGECGD